MRRTRAVGRNHVAATAATASRGGSPPWSPPFARARRGCPLVSLRPLERLLPHPARTIPHVLVRGLVVTDGRARSRPGGEARAGVPQARPRTGDAPARRRVWLGQHGPPRGATSRRASGW